MLSHRGKGGGGTVNFFGQTKFTGIQQDVTSIEFLKIGRNIRLCYSRHLIFTGIQNYRNSVYRNSPEFTGIHEFLFVGGGEVCSPTEVRERVGEKYNEYGKLVRRCRVDSRLGRRTVD